MRQSVRNDSNTGENNSSKITLCLTSANSLKEAINVNDYKVRNEGEVVKSNSFLLAIQHIKSIKKVS
jgi:hypothetical protein